MAQLQQSSSLQHDDVFQQIIIPFTPQLIPSAINFSFIQQRRVRFIHFPLRFHILLVSWIACIIAAVNSHTVYFTLFYFYLKKKEKKTNWESIKHNVVWSEDLKEKKNADTGDSFQYHSLIFISSSDPWTAWSFVYLWVWILILFPLSCVRVIYLKQRKEAVMAPKKRWKYFHLDQSHHIRRSETRFSQMFTTKPSFRSFTRSRDVTSRSDLFRVIDQLKAQKNRKLVRSWLFLLSYQFVLTTHFGCLRKENLLKIIQRCFRSSGVSYRDKSVRWFEANLDISMLHCGVCVWVRWCTHSSFQYCS